MLGGRLLVLGMWPTAGSQKPIAEFEVYPTPMTPIQIIREEESPAGGWLFHAQVLDADGEVQKYQVRLSWADYNLWSASGADAPAQVAEAVIAYMLTIRSAGELPESFDASLTRRLSPDADEHLPKMIQDGA